MSVHLYLFIYAIELMEKEGGREEDFVSVFEKLYKWKAVRTKEKVLKVIVKYILKTKCQK